MTEEELGADIPAPATEPSAAPPVVKDRAASLAATRQAKFDELFKGRHYKIVKVIALQGEQRFQTPFGNKGRNGFALIPDDRSFTSVAEEKAAAIFVGATVLAKAAADYGAVEVPEKVRKRRTSEQKAADVATKKAQREADKAAKAQAKEDAKVAKSAFAQAILEDGGVSSVLPTDGDPDAVTQTAT